MKKAWSVKSLTLAAMVAALYTALTLAFQPISFQQVQFRISEALTLLPVLFVEAVPGLTVGCLISNLLAGANPYDVVFGTLATLLGALLTRKLRKNVWLAALPPVLCNGIIIGLVLTYAYGIDLLWLNMLTVSLGQAVVCYGLGVPMIKALDRVDLPVWDKER